MHVYACVCMCMHVIAYILCSIPCVCCSQPGHFTPKVIAIQTNLVCSLLPRQVCQEHKTSRTLENLDPMCVHRHSTSTAVCINDTCTVQPNTEVLMILVQYNYTAVLMILVQYNYTAVLMTLVQYNHTLQ